MPARPKPDTLVMPLRRLLRPLVRLMIRCGVTFPAVTDILRALYLEAAAEELAPDQRTDSRVSLMTGIHRKEIRRQRQHLAEEQPPPLVTRNALLIATWLGSDEYCDDTGRPLALARTGAGTPSFERLVASVTRDVRSRAVLDDWLAQGIATLDSFDRVVLSVDAFVPQPGREEQLFYFARNLHDHIAAGAANVLSDGVAPFLDRSVHYDRLTPAAAAQLEHFSREAAQKLLLEVNQRALRLAAVEVPAGQPARRVNLGVFVFTDDESAS